MLSRFNLLRKGLGFKCQNLNTNYFKNFKKNNFCEKSTAPTVRIK